MKIPWSAWMWVKRMWQTATRPLALLQDFADFQVAWRRQSGLNRILHDRLTRIERHLHLDRVLDRANTGPNRNRKCSCKSGKKFKNCCGKKGKRG